MTTCVKRLSIVSVVVTGALLVPGAAFFRWYLQRAPTFQFLGDQQPVHQVRHQESRTDTYTFSGEFESVCVQISEELSRIGYVESNPGGEDRDTCQTFSRLGPRGAMVIVHRGKFEPTSEQVVGADGSMRDWVTVQVAYNRPALWKYVLKRLTHGPLP